MPGGHSLTLPSWRSRLMMQSKLQYNAPSALDDNGRRDALTAGAARCDGSRREKFTVARCIL